MDDDDYQDDSTIADDAIVWRRVPPEQTKLGLDGRPVPSTGAFNDSSNSPMSATLAAGSSVQAVHKWYPTHGIVAIRAGRLRELGQRLVRAPTEADPAHILVAGRKPKGGFRKKLQRESDWVVLPYGYREQQGE